MGEREIVASVPDLIGACRSVHMSGIGGVGMAGLALLLRAKGLPVSGCDLQQGPYAGGLAAAGIVVSDGHAADQVAAVDWVIRSAAVREDQPDVQHALARGLPVYRRGEVLSVLVRGAAQSVAVAGTHGKTTTATLVAQLLADLHPAWCIGGTSSAYPMPGGAGAGPLVVEADESDGTLARYAPSVALVTNVDFDHMEHFASAADFDACFQAFLGNARDRVVYCRDDVRATALAQESGQLCLGYGFDASADVRGEWAGTRSLHVFFPGGRHAQLTLPEMLPGQHNAVNVLGALAVCHVLDVPFRKWRGAVARLHLPARRFETLGVHGGVRVVSDYAHHPVEIRALIQMARVWHRGRIVALFQPHRYSRTVALCQDFPPAFEGVSHLVLAPVYAASETPVPGGTAADLLRQFDKMALGYCVELADDLAAAAALALRDLQPGDLVLIIGAGDVEKAGRMIVDAIRGLNAEE